MFGYDKLSESAANTLDSYDFTQLLKECSNMDVSDIREVLKQVSSQVDDALQELSEDELCEYLRERYRMEVSEIVRCVVSWTSDSLRRCNDMNMPKVAYSELVRKSDMLNLPSENSVSNITVGPKVVPEINPNSIEITGYNTPRYCYLKGRACTLATSTGACSITACVLPVTD